MAKKPSKRKGNVPEKVRHTVETEIFAKALEPLIQQLLVTKEISLDTFGKEVAPLAAIRMASLLMSEKDEVALKASEKIMDRELGRPVERRQVLHADVKDLSNKQLDNEILRYLKKDPTLLREIEGKILAEVPLETREVINGNARTPVIVDVDEKL